MTEYDWQEVLLRVLDGDSEALGLLCQHYLRPKIYPFVLQRLKHSQDAEDVVQTVFADLVGYTPKIRKRSLKSFEQFVFTMAKNASFNLWRERQKSSSSGDRIIAPRPTTPYQEFERQELRELLDMAMEDKLTEKERQIIAMRMLMQYSFRKIAELTGIPLTTLHSRYQQALGKMSQHPALCAFWEALRRKTIHE